MKGFEADTDLESWELRKLLYGINGKQTSFYLPSYRNDFQIAGTIAAGSTSLRVTDVGYEKFIDGTVPYAAVMIQLHDASAIGGETKFFRTISVTSTPLPGEEILTLDSPIDPGTAVDPSDVLRISYLYLSRFATDKIQITHNLSLIHI